MNWKTEKRKCPTCVRNYGRHYLIDCDITEYETRINYAFHCGHFKNVRKVIE
jgi:hypothetical protein